MRTRRLGVLTVACMLVGCAIERRVDRTVEEVPEVSTSEFLRLGDGAAPPVGVKSGDLAWIWAMVGTVPASTPPTLVEGGIGPETRQALENVVAILGSAGAAPRDVAQCSVFLADLAEADAMRAVYAEFFPAPPTRVALAATPLSLGARVEVECTAVLPSEP